VFICFGGTFAGPQTAFGTFHFVPSFHLGAKVPIVVFILLPPEPEQALEIEIIFTTTRRIWEYVRSRYKLNEEI
jgi:hypothetical protein